MRRFTSFLHVIAAAALAAWALGCSCPQPTGTSSPATASTASGSHVQEPSKESDKAEENSGNGAGEGGDTGSKKPDSMQGTVDNAPEQGQPCPEGSCADGFTCVEYYGIAGARGPKFNSCEIPCGGKGTEGCPQGQACITIADGPGQVCRPKQ